MRPFESRRRRLPSLVALTLAGLAVCACSTTAADVATDEAALTDISGCESSAARSVGQALEADGYTLTGTSKYEVVYYQFASSYYWKQVDALRYEKGANVRYATCKGVVESPLTTDTGLTLAGKMFGWGQPKDPGSSFTNPHADPGYFTGPTDATATVAWKGFSLDPLGGAAQLTVHVKAQKATKTTDGMTIVTSIDDDVVLERNGSTWKNDRDLVSLEIVDQVVVGATITTRPLKRSGYSEQYGRGQFRYSAPSTSAPSVDSKTIRLVDLPAASGIKAVPSKLTYSPSEGRSVTIRNESSFDVTYTSPAATPGSLRRNETVTTTVGLPTSLRFENGSDELLVDLELAP